MSHPVGRAGPARGSLDQGWVEVSPSIRQHGLQCQRRDPGSHPPVGAGGEVGDAAASDWPVLSASATSSAKEPLGGPMMAKLEPLSQKPTGLSLRANEPLKETGRAGEGPGGQGQADGTALTLFGGSGRINSKLTK